MQNFLDFASHPAVVYFSYPVIAMVLECIIAVFSLLSYLALEYCVFPLFRGLRHVSVRLSEFCVGGYNRFWWEFKNGNIIYTILLYGTFLIYYVVYALWTVFLCSNTSALQECLDSSLFLILLLPNAFLTIAILPVRGCRVSIGLPLTLVQVAEQKAYGRSLKD